MRDDDEPTGRPNKRRREDDVGDEVEPAGRPKKQRADRDDEADKSVGRPRKRKKKKRPAEGYGGLGPQKEVFTPNVGLFRPLAILCCVAAIGGLLSCILSMVLGGERSALVAIAVLGTPGGMIGLLWCMDYLTLKVEVHAGGLVHMHRGQSREVSWDEVRYVWQEITEHHRNGGYVGTTYVYTIELADRSQLKYTNSRIKNVEKLGEMILRYTSESMLSQVRAVYEKGEVMNFGKLGVNKEGLHYGKHVLQWDDVKGVKVADGYISVSKRGKWLRWCSIAASSVPNLQVFLTFVNQIVGVEEG